MAQFLRAVAILLLLDFFMADGFTIKSSTDSRALPSHDYWQIAREIKKQEAIYPKHTRAAIQSAVELAFSKGGRRDPAAIDRYISMYLTMGKAP